MFSNRFAPKRSQLRLSNLVLLVNGVFRERQVLAHRPPLSSPPSRIGLNCDQVQ
jgi:hypothetical protein